MSVLGERQNIVMDSVQIIRRCVPRSVRNWLRTPRRTLAYLAAYGAHTLGYAPEIEIRPGWRIRCHPVSRGFFEVFSKDSRQRAELDAFIARCSPGMRLLDIGAHHGLFALSALQCGGNTARVVAVEASPKAARVLRTNLRLNCCGERASVVEVAAGDSEGTLAVLTTGPHAGDYVVVAPGDRKDACSVPMKPLDSICLENGIEPTHLKIDVEGFEEEVLRGAGAVLKRCRPVVFLELHGGLIRTRHRSAEAVLDLLEQAGYQGFEHEGAPVDRGAIGRAGYNCRLVCLP